VIPKARRQGLRLLITPDTIVCWHRDIARRRWAARSKHGRTGRPATRRNIRALVRRLARENPHWGYRRIHGELAGLGVKVAASTVWEILKASGIDPGRRQAGLTWPQFLRSQAESIPACDFFTVDLPDGTQAYVLAIIEHATRRIRTRPGTPLSRRPAVADAHTPSAGQDMCRILPTLGRPDLHGHLSRLRQRFPDKPEDREAGPTCAVPPPSRHLSARRRHRPRWTPGIPDDDLPGTCVSRTDTTPSAQHFAILGCLIT
jgi:transposase